MRVADFPRRVTDSDLKLESTLRNIEDALSHSGPRRDCGYGRWYYTLWYHQMWSGQSFWRRWTAAFWVFLPTPAKDRLRDRPFRLKELHHARRK